MGLNSYGWKLLVAHFLSVKEVFATLVSEKALEKSFLQYYKNFPWSSECISFPTALQWEKDREQWEKEKIYKQGIYKQGMTPTADDEIQKKNNNFPCLWDPF